MNREERRKLTYSKYISRAKEWFRMDLHSKEYSSWKEFASKNKWVKMLKHNKLYGRSTMNNIEKHNSIKKIREETKKSINDDYLEKICGSCNWSCCDPLKEECKYHPIDKDRWCHKFEKSVWTLEDASNCEEYFD